MEKNIRKQADELYRRGLLVFNQPITKERLKLVSELWQKALKLYCRVGDRSKAREIEKALINLYKKKSIKINKKERQGSN
ncbi:MAG: hypothetical protein OEY92_03625, partial [Elusimicrobiota bacterium]|nr:hypothetical protein [Elusimicrobiota bacterium]